MGIPSETFRRAVEIWNSSKTPSGEPDFEIPGMSALQPTSGTEAKEVESALHT